MSNELIAAAPFDGPTNVALEGLIEANTKRWALKQVPYFRGMGFFSDLTERSDAEILLEIYRRYVDAEGVPYRRQGKLPPPWTIDNLNRPLADLDLLQYDASRVWWEDTECVYPPEQLAYQAAISRWAAVSRNAFAPISITETWDGTDDAPTSPIVRITLSSGTLTLEPLYRDDWFDLSVLQPINDCIRDSDIRFELFEQFDQTAFVVALTPQEREELSKSRGWSFRRFSG